MASSRSLRNRPPDYYEILGVAPEANHQEIAAAYWAQATGEGDSHRIALLNEAYEVLGHQDRRAAYDAERPAPQKEPEPEAPEEGLPRGNPGLAEKLRWYLR